MIQLIGIKLRENNVLSLCNSIETLNQINELNQYEWDLYDPDEEIGMESFYDKDSIYIEDTEHGHIFNYLIADRMMRSDRDIKLDRRPPIAIITIEDKKIKRLEWYEGDRALKLVYDIRSKELMDLKLESHLTSFFNSKEINHLN